MLIVYYSFFHPDLMSGGRFFADMVDADMVGTDAMDADVVGADSVGENATSMTHWFPSRGEKIAVKVTFVL